MSAYKAVIVTDLGVRGDPFSFKGNTDSFAPSAQNDKPFSHCKHRKARGNPFSIIIKPYLPYLILIKLFIKLGYFFS